MRVLPWTVMFPALTMYWNESNIFWLPIARSKVGSWISDWRLSRHLDGTVRRVHPFHRQFERFARGHGAHGRRNGERFFGFDAWNGELLVIILTQQERKIAHDMPLQPHHTAENTI